jgi:hypothetical protein
MATAFSRERARTVVIALVGPAHRSLLLFAIWSSFTHAAIMLVMAGQVPAQRGVLLISAAVTALAGILLLVVRPATTVAERSRLGPK